VGLPYLVVSASGPLLQHWFAESAHGRSPYRLYAVSNVGSLLALLSYPFLVEPVFALTWQTWLWSGGYVAYAVMVAACAWVFLRRGETLPSEKGEECAFRQDAGGVPGSPWIDRILWIAFPACGTILLLAMTSHMTQDVAVVPFLWVLPLALYLTTFIITFDHPRWYHRGVWIPLAALAVGALVYMLVAEGSDNYLSIAGQIGVCAAVVFFACMICHGEAVRLKPHPRRLTSFYLAISFGGALGGAFVGLVAPRIFDGYWELHLGLMMLAALTSLALVRDRKRFSAVPAFGRGAGALVGVQAILVLGFFLGMHIRDYHEGSSRSLRNFYGVLRVFEGYEWDGSFYKSLLHGRITHGFEYFDGPWVNQPVSYFSEGSGPDAVFKTHPKRFSGAADPMRIGVVGLGIGTVAAYANEGDTIRFYEINEQVIDVAWEGFDYLENCAGDVDVVLGDGRIALERELAAGEPGHYDVLVLDAFSGDGVPMHLLTKEAFALYRDHMAPGGAILVNITNRYIDLRDAVRTQAAEIGFEAVWIEHWDNEAVHSYYSSWIILTNDKPFAARLAGQSYANEWESDEPEPILWTDDYSNLLSVLHWE